MSPNNGAQLPLVGKPGPLLVEGVRNESQARGKAQTTQESKERSNQVSILEEETWKEARVMGGSSKGVARN